MRKIGHSVKKTREATRQKTYGFLRRHPRLARVYLALRRKKTQLVRWWQKNDRRYGMRWRLANGAAALLILLSAVMPAVSEILTAQAYALSADTRQLIGTTDGRLTKQLSYDAQTATYQFNKTAIKSADDNPITQLKAQTGTAAGGSDDSSLYALDVPTDARKGVTYHDINSGLSFTLAADFNARDGRDIDGHLVFPLTGGNQAIYTLKNNGLKEDIVVPKVTADQMTFTYTVTLPKTLAMKIIPDSGGAVGIYSADPALFGDMQYGSDADRTAMQKARENAEKNYLVFGLPAPVAKNLKGETVGTSKFELEGSTLKVIATGLAGQTGPITIDPSVVVTSTSDFQTGGNNDSNIDFSTSGQLTRGSVTGGSVGSWTTNTQSLSSSSYGYTTVVYNGHIYTVASYASSLDMYTIKQTINSDGTIGAPGTTGSSYEKFGQAAVYNGYLYSIGGGSSTPVSGVAYAPIDPTTGSVGTWKNTSALSSPRRGFSTVVYNGYIYAIGGETDVSGGAATVEYAPINADGTLGTWTSTTSFTTGRKGLSAATYNGYIYIAGGSDGSTYYNDVQYASIKSDGTLGAWMSGPSFANGRYFGGMVATGGYLYFMGGTNFGTYFNDTQYAPIYANGSLGAWTYTQSFTTGRAFEQAATYNGYIYILGGAIDLGGTQYSDIQYTKIDPPGQIKSLTTAASTGTGSINARSGATSFSYNGYLYTFGGTYSSAVQTNIQKVAINADGSLGNITNGTALGTATSNYAFAFYNGYIYIIGGTNTAGTPRTTVQYGSFNANGTINWGTTTDLPSGVAYQSAVASGGYLFLLGTSGSGTSNTIQAAPINSDGTLGSWTNQTQTLSTARVKASLLAYDNILYVVGGQDGTPSTSYASVEYAPLNTTSPSSASAVISGAFATTSSLNTSRAQFGATVINGYMYVVGGTSTTSGVSTDQSTAEFARIKNDGSLDTWTSTSLGTTISGVNGLTVSNGTVYSIAPVVSGSRSSGIMTFKYNNGGNGTSTGSGTAGQFNTANDVSAIYPSGVIGHKVFAAKGYLYVAGGFDGTTVYGSVYSAKINDDGSLGTWTATSSLNTARYNFGVGVIGDYVYAVAGVMTRGGKTDSIEYAHINTDGTLSAWTTSTYSVSGIRASPAVTTYNGRLYVLGGNGSGSTVYADVQYFKGGSGEFNTNGGCGSAVCTANSFTTGRYTHVAVGYNDYLYIIGGKTGAGGQLGDAQVAQINSDGSLGTWKATTPLPYAAANSDIVTVNGYIIMIGGINASTAINGEMFVPILADGNLGDWQFQIGSLSMRRSQNSIEYYNGYIYTIGGSTAAVDYNDVQYGTLNVQPRVGYYSKLIDLGSPSNITSVSYNGVLPYGDASVTYRAAGSNGVFGSTNYTNTISGTGTCTGTVTNARYLYIMVAINDSTGKGNGAVYPDPNGISIGLNGHLDDLTVNYNATHPPPDQRLRGGKTLQNGSLSPFDTCQL